MAKALETLVNTNNDGQEDIGFTEPFIAEVTIRGTSALLFHRWSVEGVEEKAKAAKGSKAKKTDNVESYVYRNEKGYICIPNTYFRGSIVNAAKFLQDPRSPRKSAMDLFKAGVIVLDELSSLGSKDWDYLDRRRVTVQRAGITRARPAFNAGWECSFHCQVVLPEYVNSDLLNEVIQKAGKLVGLGDDRPSYGRFLVTGFKVVAN